MTVADPSRAPRPSSLPDHASEADTRGLRIDRVGVRDLSYPIQVMDKAKGLQSTVAKISCSVSLPHDRKGTHMSRFIEVLNEVRGEVTVRSLPLILEKIQARLEAEEAFMELEFPYFLTKRAPVSGAESLMQYRCRFRAHRSGTSVDFVLGVEVPLKSLCPCSKAISDRGAHNQRSLVEVEIRSRTFIWLEDLIEVVERCGSAPLFALLKREDEKYVTELAYDNPKFVEDLVRDVILQVRRLEGVHWIHVTADNQESIHNHAAYGESTWSEGSP